MSTDLEQLSKELELVHRRELDPFAKPLPEPDVREITNERIVEPEGSADKVQRFGSACYMSDEQLASSYSPEDLAYDNWRRAVDALNVELDSKGYVIDPGSIRISISRDQMRYATIFRIDCEASKVEVDTDVIRINRRAMAHVMKRVMEKYESR